MEYVEVKKIIVSPPRNKQNHTTPQQGTSAIGRLFASLGRKTEKSLSMNGRARIGGKFASRCPGCDKMIIGQKLCLECRGDERAESKS